MVLMILGAPNADSPTKPAGIPCSCASAAGMAWPIGMPENRRPRHGMWCSAERQAVGIGMMSLSPAT